MGRPHYCSDLLGDYGRLIGLGPPASDRFYTILIRPQWRSWVAIGTFILLFFGVIVGLSILAAFAGAGGLMQVLWWPGGVLAILAAIYTGFIFAQSKARDLC